MKELLNKIHSDVRLSAIFYGVLSSLAATVLWNYSWAVLTWLGGYSFGLLEGFVDSRFTKAATLEPTNYSYLLIALLFIVIAIGWFEISGRIKKDLNERLGNPEGAEKPDNNNNEIPRWVPKAFFAVRMMILFYLLSGLLFITGEVIVLNAISDFNQHIRIITPYVTEEEKDMVLSKWSQIRGLEDYNNIYGELLKIAKENNLTLYKNKTY
jgi:hypothetical protein